MYLNSDNYRPYLDIRTNNNSTIFFGFYLYYLLILLMEESKNKLHSDTTSRVQLKVDTSGDKVRLQSGFSLFNLWHWADKLIVSMYKIQSFAILYVLQAKACPGEVVKVVNK